MRFTLAAALILGAGACAERSPLAQFDGQAAEGREVAPKPRYSITLHDASLGGTQGVPNSIDQHGNAAGWSNRTGNFTREAVIWRGDQLIELGTLGGPNSSVQWPGQSRSGMVVGIAEMDLADSLSENWSCSAFFPSVTRKVCRGFAWEGGAMTPMPTFGGTHSYAAGVNARGDVVGWAETAVHHESCVAPQRLQFVAALWSPRTGAMRQLRPFGDDPTSAATAINERGQVVGISGLCDNAVGRFSAMHAVMWDGDEVIDLGHLGGEAWHTPTAINDRGEVVGFTNPSGVTGGTFLPRAFKWSRHGGMVELKRLDGDTFAQAYGMNSRGQVVGRSCGGPAGCRAVLWEGTEPSLLKSLVDPNFPHALAAARDINDAGVIAGNLTHATTGATHAFTARESR